MSDASAYKLRDGRVIYYKDAVARKYLSSIAASVAVEPEQQEVAFDCGDDNIPAKPVLSKIKIRLDPKVVGIGELTKTNPFEISKWNSIAINVSNAKNVVPMTVTYTVGKRIDVNDGSEKNSPAYMVPEEYIPIESGKKYYCSCFQEGSATTGFTIIQYDENMAFMPSKTETIVADGKANSGKLSGSFTSDQNAKYIRYNVGKTKTDVVISEEEDFVATTKTIEIRDDLNAYGGELSYLGSKQWLLKVTHVGLTFNGTEDQWQYGGTVANGTLFFYYPFSALTGDFRPRNTDDLNTYRCSHFKNGNVTSTNQNKGCYIYYSNGVQSGRINIRDDIIQDYDEGNNLVEFKNFLESQYRANHPVTCYWELLVPRLYIISEDGLDLHTGSNILRVSDGVIEEFEYHADLDPEDYLYDRFLSRLGSAIAPIEKGTVASKAYAKDDYLIFNDCLCKVSKAIAVGATLAIGTNLTKTTIAEELKALR